MISKLKMIAYLFNDYNYLARDDNGEVWLFKSRPTKHCGLWKDPDHNVWLKINIDYDSREEFIELRDYRYRGLQYGITK